MPAAPWIEIESVFVVVAAPQATGVVPKWSAPPETTSVAVDPSATTAATDFVPAV